MWRVQRLRLDEARAQFFMREKQQTQVCKKMNMKRGKLLKRLLLRQVRGAILTKALMTFFQAMLEKYPLGQQRLPMEVLPSVPSAQQTAPQPTLV